MGARVVQNGEIPDRSVLREEAHTTRLLTEISNIDLVDGRACRLGEAVEQASAGIPVKSRLKNWQSMFRSALSLCW